MLASRCLPDLASLLKKAVLLQKEVSAFVAFCVLKSWGSFLSCCGNYRQCLKGLSQGSCQVAGGEARKCLYPRRVYVGRDITIFALREKERERERAREIERERQNNQCGRCKTGRKSNVSLSCLFLSLRKTSQTRPSSLQGPQVVIDLLQRVIEAVCEEVEIPHVLHFNCCAEIPPQLKERRKLYLELDTRACATSLVKLCVWVAGIHDVSTTINMIVCMHIQYTPCCG